MRATTETKLAVTLWPIEKALIAAVATRRVCYAIEQSPAFCDAAVERWQRFSGKEAKRG